MSDADEDFRKALVPLIPHLRAFARTFVKQPADADDLVQDTIVKALVSRSQYTDGTNLRAWTFMILRNNFLSGTRRSWRQVQLDPEDAERRLVANADPTRALELDDVRRALDKLPLPQREALILVGAGGLAYDEAATIMGVPIGTVKSRVNRARAALEAILANERVERDEKRADTAMAEIIKELETRRGGSDR